MQNTTHLAGSQRPGILDDVVFGLGPNAPRIWPDGYDWVGTIDIRNNGIRIAADRLLCVVRDSFSAAPDNSMISDFDDQLIEVAAQLGNVLEEDAIFFLGKLKQDIVDALPGMPGVGPEYDAAVLLNAYGKISKEFPNFDIRPTFGERIRNILSPVATPTPEAVYEAVANSIAAHLDVAEENGIQLGSDRLAAFERMIDAVWGEIDADTINEWTLRQVDQVRQRVEKASQPDNATSLSF